MKKITLFITGAICIILVGFATWFAQYQLNTIAKGQWQNREKLLKLIVQSYYSDWINAQMANKISQIKVSALISSIKCENTSDYVFDMSSNEAVSTSLKEYANATIGLIKSADWKIIRPASEDAIHQLQGQSPAVYVAVFKDRAVESSSSYLFDIYNHCYLVLPE